MTELVPGCLKVEINTYGPRGTHTWQIWSFGNMPHQVPQLCINYTLGPCGIYLINQTDPKTNKPNKQTQPFNPLAHSHSWPKPKLTQFI